jgi:tetratricopeptide (TPR) repeat protein
MSDQPIQPPSKDQFFFGLAPERLQAMADEAERRFEQARIAYADALIAVGNAHLTHASPAVLALSAFQKALVVYSLPAADNKRVADIHHRLASVLRRLGEYGQAAEHLAEAIVIWDDKGTTEGQFVERWRQELNELRTVHQSSLERRHPPG